MSKCLLLMFSLWTLLPLDRPSYQITSELISGALINVRLHLEKVQTVGHWQKPGQVVPETQNYPDYIIFGFKLLSSMMGKLPKKIYIWAWNGRDLLVLLLSLAFSSFALLSWTHDLSVSLSVSSFRFNVNEIRIRSSGNILSSYIWCRDLGCNDGLCWICWLNSLWFQRR